ncbi:hypothetical protein P43SY_001046 [Pythium insidiosum]|uniref:Protein kinase domain-containing protein n=1 Tax=Pythium insidiosum TaxID=114742 RepID=A0AAD5Q5W8_PYTIN|nr:hypothetical protein P43SY_001046 [Pythium insidiosum]
MRLDLFTDQEVMMFVNRIVSVYPSSTVSLLPWSTGLWPAYLDGIDHRWQSPDELSPAEKYAAAFGLNVEQFTRQLSEISGVDSQSRLAPCSNSSVCGSLICGKRRGKELGRCHRRESNLKMTTVLAAVEVNEPKCTIQKNGITFHPQDIKAFQGVSLWDEELLLDRYIPPSSITDVRVLSGGAYSVVYLVQLGTNKHFAASKRLAASFINNCDMQKQLLDEIKLNATLQHPNVASLLGASWITRLNLQAIFEYLPGGDLLSYLETRRTPKTMVWTREKLLLALDVAYALAYIHSLLPSPVVHRDLKSRNVLLSATEGSKQRLTAKLCDFGVSRAQSSNHSMTTGVGTSRWLAPEVILGGGRYDAACDIYSFGVLLTELDTHEIPFNDVRGPVGTMLPDVAILRMVAHEGLRPSVSESCPEALATLVSECMAHDAACARFVLDV